MNREKVLDEINTERQRQDAKWGEQNHPDLNMTLLAREGGCTPARMAEHYEIPSAVRATFLCEEMFRRGQGTWAHVLVEEVAEAVGTLGDTKALREELVQVAAVAVAWIEAIDRRDEVTYAEAPELFPPHPGCGMRDCPQDHEWWPNQTLQFANWLVDERKPKTTTSDSEEEK